MLLYTYFLNYYYEEWVPLGSSKILVTAIWALKKKKSPNSLLCLLALFEQNYYCDLKREQNIP